MYLDGPRSTRCSAPQQRKSAKWWRRVRPICRVLCASKPTALRAPQRFDQRQTAVDGPPAGAHKHSCEYPICVNEVSPDGLLRMRVPSMTTQLSMASVTPDNFVRAESDLYFGNIVKDGGFGKFLHRREPA